MSKLWLVISLTLFTAVAVTSIKKCTNCNICFQNLTSCKVPKNIRNKYGMCKTETPPPTPCPYITDIFSLVPVDISNGDILDSVEIDRVGNLVAIQNGYIVTDPVVLVRADDGLVQAFLYANIVVCNPIGIYEPGKYPNATGYIQIVKDLCTGTEVNLYPDFYYVLGQDGSIARTIVGFEKLFLPALLDRYSISFTNAVIKD